MAVGIGVFLLFMYRMEFDSLVWTKGVEGERKTAEYLEPLMAEGYVALYNRLTDGLEGDIDCLLIGPTGVFVIETKNWSGKVWVRPQAVLLGESDRTWAAEQVYRAAIAVQIGLRDELNPRKVTVTPVLCVIDGVRTGGNVAAGVRVTGANALASVIRSHPPILDETSVRAISTLAESRLRQQYVWDIE